MSYCQMSEMHVQCFTDVFSVPSTENLIWLQLRRSRVIFRRFVEAAAAKSQNDPKMSSEKLISGHGDLGQRD